MSESETAVLGMDRDSNPRREEEQSQVPDEIAHDPYSMLLYKKAIRRGKERERTLRINVVGNYAQGKTSLVKRLVDETCESVTTTNGIQITRYKCKSTEEGKQTPKLRKTSDEDNEHISRVASVARSFKTSYEIKHKNVNSEGETTHTDSEQILSPKSQTRQPQLPVDPNKTETLTGPKATRCPSSKVKNVSLKTKERNLKRPMAFSYEEFSKFRKMIEESESELPIHLDIWDFGGQFVFYATHRLFHSRKALYLLVFDLSLPLDTIVRDEEFPGETGDKDMEYFARFWIESIHAYAGSDPQVILVGTHKDKLAGNENIPREYFERVRCLFDDTDLIKHIQEEQFAVNNHDDTDHGIEELYNLILKKYQQLAHPVEIPIRWIQMEKALKDLQQKKVISFQEVMQINEESEYPLEEEEQVKLFLQYHHEKGSFFYFDEDELNDVIVLDPKYLIDAFKCIITSERFCRNDPDIRPFWQSLTTQGILTNTLIDKVWSKGPEDFLKHKNVLLGFLTKYNIISGVAEYDVNTGSSENMDWYIVPSLLNKHNSGEEMSRFLHEKIQTKIRYVIRFENTTIVHVVYHRLIAAALGNWPVVKFGNKMLLFENMSVFSLENHHAGIIELRHQIGTIELRVVNLQPFPVACYLVDQFRRFVESKVVEEFRKLKTGDGRRHKPYSRAYRCNDRSHGYDGEGSLNISLLKEDKSVNCPDNFTHDLLYYKQAQIEWFLPNVSDEVYPKMQLTEKILSTLAQAAFGENWSLLGIELNILQIEIDQIKLDNHTTAMQIYCVLQKWKTKAEDKATLDVLVDAVRKCPGVSVDWNEFRNLRDEFSSKGAVLVQPLSNKTLKVHETLILECEITKSDVSATWHKDNVSIDPNDERMKICRNGGNHQLKVENVTLDDSASYRCDFGNTNTECFVTVEDPEAPLAFINRLEDIEIADTPCTATFTCVLNKRVPAQWYFNNQAVLHSNKHTIINSGNIHKLEIRDVSESDEGRYSIVADGELSRAVLCVEETDEEKMLFAQHLKNQKDKNKRFKAVDNIMKQPQDAVTVPGHDESTEILDLSVARVSNSITISARSSTRPHVWSVKTNVKKSIKVPGDKSKCAICGCCQLPSGEILLADSYNARLKKLDARYQVIGVCDLPGFPWDVCYIGNDEAVVSLLNQKLQFVDVTGMTLTRSVGTEHDCRGLVCHGNKLYVTDGATVCMYSADGIMQRELYTLSPTTLAYLFPYIAVSDDGSKIYITNRNKLITIDSSGKHLYTFTDPELKRINGVCVDGEGHVLVCDWRTDSILKLSSDGKHKLSTIANMSEYMPRLLCFDRVNSCVVVAGRSDYFNVLQLQ